MKTETKMILLTLLAVVLGFATMWFWVESNHYKHDCTGHKTGKCSWAWCKYYDGSDSLHDFNF